MVDRQDVDVPLSKCVVNLVGREGIQQLLRESRTVMVDSPRGLQATGSDPTCSKNKR